NTKVDPQLAANLHSIYNYMFDRLTEANLHDDQQALAEVLDIMTELRSTWAEAELMIRSGNTAGTETSARAA
ncbi:MAG TPA: flagellar protein FliS, partial [Armatimonadota bacterium]|nr:flagellar protein FliS [Armatimonadota bacterium]